MSALVEMLTELIMHDLNNIERQEQAEVALVIVTHARALLFESIGDCSAPGKAQHDAKKI